VLAPVDFSVFRHATGRRVPILAVVVRDVDTILQNKPEQATQKEFKKTMGKRRNKESKKTVRRK
jgi:hypothetical protein